MHIHTYIYTYIRNVKETFISYCVYLQCMNDDQKIKVIFQFDPPLIIEMEPSRAFNLIDNFYGRSTEISSHYQKKGLLLKVPNRVEIENFIKAQPNYQFSFESISQHFLGDEISNSNKSELNKCINAIRSKTNRIRQAIAESENGQWTSYYDGRNKVYEFIKSEEETITDSTQEDNEAPVKQFG